MDRFTKTDIIPSVLILLALLSMVLTACVPVQSEVAQPQNPVVESGEVDVLNTPILVSPETTVEGGEQPLFTPTIRQELFASDPANFNLANGEVQFVEFFAFW
jgi:hypothetical protein